MTRHAAEYPFAQPAVRVCPHHEKTRRARIGLAGQTTRVPRALVRHHALAADGGVRVTSVEADGPADRAGLLTGDVVVSFDGSRVADVDDLVRLLADAAPGRRVALVALRLTEAVRLTVEPA